MSQSTIHHSRKSNEYPDNQTDKTVMYAINNLDKNINIILVTNRLANVKSAIKFFLLKISQLKMIGFLIN
jgi:hypothetical protein